MIDQILLTCSLFSYTAFDLLWRVKYFHLNSPSRGLPQASPQWRTRIIALSILDLKTLREGKDEEKRKRRIRILNLGSVVIVKFSRIHQKRAPEWNGTHFQKIGTKRLDDLN